LGSEIWVTLIGCKSRVVMHQDDSMVFHPGRQRAHEHIVGGPEIRKRAHRQPGVIVISANSRDFVFPYKAHAGGSVAAAIYNVSETNKLITSAPGVIIGYLQRIKASMDIAD